VSNYGSFDSAHRGEGPQVGGVDGSGARMGAGAREGVGSPDVRDNHVETTTQTSKRCEVVVCSVLIYL
jgi:hypothetical protein